MTLCGWKIFSKNKQRTKRLKGNDGKGAALPSLSNEDQEAEATTSSGLKPTSKTTSFTLSSKEGREDQDVTDKIIQFDDGVERDQENGSNNCQKDNKAKSETTVKVENEKCANEKSFSAVEVKIEDDDGNPRNKCALKPGHSLMHWIRLGSSGCDLAGTKGIITAVTLSELAKHNKKTDAWLAVRGKVYNVTHYMDFHPGGPDELMKGLGKDATKLFDEVHAWVNYEQLLSKCFIGPLRSIGVVDLEPLKLKQTSKSNPGIDTSSGGGNNFKTPILPFFGSVSAKSSPVKGGRNSSNSNILNQLPSSSSASDIHKSSGLTTGDLNTNRYEKKDDNMEAERPPEIIPRFDWIQKTSMLFLVFYTKSFCNPGLIVNQKSDNELDVRILIERTIHLYSFRFTHNVDWPCLIKISNETGKIEMTLMKRERELWISFGLLDRKKLTNFELDNDYEYKIKSNVQITHDSYALALEPVQNTFIIAPIGFHISLTVFINGEYITRSYTPVPVGFLPGYEINDSRKPFIPLLVKSYTSGTLAKHITKSNFDDVLKVSRPKGNFQLTSMLNHNRIGLLAAGSGITPILGILYYLLGLTTNKIEHVELLFFNKTEEDIWCQEKLKAFSDKDSRLTVRHILSEPHEGWEGETGRISEDLISPFSDQKHSSYVTFCCICGPTPFNDLSQKLLKECGFQSKDMHSFQG